MALYLGNNKVSMKSGYTATIGIKEFLEHDGKFRDTNYTDLTGILKYDYTENLISMSQMFYYCKNLITIPLLNTSNIKSFEYMFYECSNLISIPQLDTSSATNMSTMFGYCKKLTTIPKLDTSKVTNMMYMFQECNNITTIPQLDTSNVIYMNNMFNYCRNLKEIHMTGMKVSFDIHYSTKFTREALLEILNNLATVTTTQTLTIGSTNLAKLTDEDKAIATNKGWTLA